MKKLLLALTLSTLPFSASADAYIMGSGRWTCADVAEAVKSGTDLQRGQLYGWILGYWSSATTTRPTSFVDIVEQAGGEAVVKKTLEECGKAPGDTLLFRVVASMIDNTG